MRRLAILCAACAAVLLPGSSVDADKPAPAVQAAVTITAPRGGQTSERIVTIKGTATGVEASRLTLVLNGVALSIPLTPRGFETTQVLAPGWNTIRVIAGTAQDEVAVFARVPRKDLRITMTWDTPETDVDLWITGPDGEKVFYSNKHGKAGGLLDVDVTNGYGPETYTQARIAKGPYRIQAHYYGGAEPTRVTVTTILHEGTPREARRVFRGILIRKSEVLEVGTFAQE